MNLREKEITYQATNTYATLNTLTNQTKNIWIVFHGMGYLSRYFLRYFETFNAVDNYFIAPQAPSKYYIGPKFKHVGASWLTKENTAAETKNVLNYVDSVIDSEDLPKNKNIILLGYSQGVSIAMRYLASKKVTCHQLIIHSGGIPKELIKEDFSFLSHQFKVNLVYGTQDEFLNEERILNEINRAKELFSNEIKVSPFDDGHIVNTAILKSLI